jgi:hypothetical protein
MLGKAAAPKKGLEVGRTLARVAWGIGRRRTHEALQQGDQLSPAIVDGGQKCVG